MKPTKTEHGDPRKVIIFVPWIGPSMNKIWAGQSWGVRKKIADEGLKAVMVALAGSGIQPFEGAVSLEFTPHHGKGSRRYDVSNYSVTNKVIEDGLVASGLLADDGFKTMTRSITNCPVKHKSKGSWMEVKIESLE